MTVSFIGAGRLGGALEIGLARRGWRVGNLVSRGDSGNAEKIAALISPAPTICLLENLPASDVVFLTVPDAEIERVAGKLAALETLAGKSAIFLHTSGALSSAVLSKLKKIGGKIGSVHPLVSVSAAETGAENFAGAFFCVEGDAEAVHVSEKIVKDLGGTSFSIPTEQKSLYHAAAVMSAGHLVALFDLASRTLADCGLEIEDARKILLPLVASTLENLKRQTPAAALTGTFARADVETLRKHLAALSGKTALAAYLELGGQSLKLAAEQGASAEKLEQMKIILSEKI